MLGDTGAAPLIGVLPAAPVGFALNPELPVDEALPVGLGVAPLVAAPEVPGLLNPLFTQFLNLLLYAAAFFDA